MIMKKTIILLCLALPILINLHVFGQATTLPAPFGPHLWTANVKVIGEDGNPITGADVTVSYDFLSASGQSGKGISWDEIKGLTDIDGMFSVSHTDTSFDLGITGKKSGYYTTHIGYQFYFDEKKWHPTFTLMLKKIGKPIPMYAKFITYIKFPVFNKPIGYDLTAGDWVAPYGKGVITDFLFTESHTNAQSGYFIIVDFPNKGDGLQEFDVPAMLQNAKMGQSDLRSSQEAPVDGYKPEFIQPQDMNLDRNYYFRVRTVLDSRGNILSTHYGKIYGDFMQFRYYLNPTPNNRNVEFDAKHNLLGGLQSYEEVRLP
jgi:hypothetical protein